MKYYRPELIVCLLVSCVETPGEQCGDDRYCLAGYQCVTTGEQQQCVFSGTCGDGAKDLDEVCDDGNRVNGDGCSFNCLSDETCGNSYVDTNIGEQCDDGNSADNDGCSFDCQLEIAPACGDGNTDDDEVCDDGNQNSGDGCSSNCLSDEICGNGYVDTDIDELCDDGNSEDNDGCSSECVPEVQVWREGIRSDLPTPRWGGAMAYDSSNQRIVLFGGFDGGIELDDTRIWNGSAWTSIASSSMRPPARTDHVMVYDIAREQIFLFGGFNGSFLNDVWVFDETNRWREVTPTESNDKSPSGRWGAAAVYDPERKEVVLFGGYDGDRLLNDTWAWDGTAWEEIVPIDSVLPPARTDHSMAYDQKRERVVVFGGFVAAADNGEIWEWDGTEWYQAEIQGSDTPTPRYAAAMVYDPRREQVLLFGGDSLDEDKRVWQWDGRIWQEAVPESDHSPSLRIDHAIAYDSAREQTVVFGGLDLEDGNLRDDTWELGSDGWILADSSDLTPSSRTGHRMVYDTIDQQIILFGGQGYNEYGDLTMLGDTWVRKGETWTLPSLDGASPAPRTGHAMAYDSKREQVVLFGGDCEDGEQKASPCDDTTWLWDGASWHLFDLNAEPSPRSNHAMVYDSQREQIVLFGGFDGTDPVGDTWTWNGNSWDRKMAGSSPSPRQGHAMAYDVERGCVVLFGGLDANNAALNDTWQWNGEEWLQAVTEDNSPFSRYGHAMAYDAKRKRVVL